jgi:hypothetical protein
MDTSVSTGMGGRVHNIGLQQQQMMTLIFGLAVAAIGILIAVLNRQGQSTSRTRVNIQQSGGQPSRDILPIAENQKYLMWAILAQIVAFVAATVLSELGLLLILVAVVAQAFFVFKISMASFPEPTGIILGVMSLIPCLGLIALLVINGVATNILKGCGVTVGFLGVPDSEIERIRASR